MSKTKFCPSCKKDHVLDKFGTRKVNGKKIPQSYCLECRSKHQSKMNHLRKKNPKLAKVDLRTREKMNHVQPKPKKAKRVSKSKEDLRQ